MTIAQVFEHNRRIEADIQLIMAQCGDRMQNLVEEDKKWFWWGLKRNDESEWVYSPRLDREVREAKQPFIDKCTRLEMLKIPHIPLSPGKVLVPSSHIDLPMYEPGGYLQL